MTSRNIIYIIFLLLTFWWVYLTSTLTDGFLNYSGHNIFVTRFTPWFNLILLIAALVFMIKKKKTGTLLLLVVVVVQTCFELAMGERHIFLVAYLLCIYLLIQNLRKGHPPAKTLTEVYVSNTPTSSGVVEKQLIDGRTVKIYSSLDFGYAIGDTVIIDGSTPPDGKYAFDEFSSINVKDGKITQP